MSSTVISIKLINNRTRSAWSMGSEHFFISAPVLLKSIGLKKVV